MADGGNSPDISAENIGRLRRQVSDKVATNLGPRADEILDRTKDQAAFRNSETPFLKDVARTAIDYRQGLIREAAKDVRRDFDSLTGLFSRDRFAEIVNEEFERSIRSGSPMAVVELDLNYLKDFNDKYGHDKGDLALKTVANILQDDSRSSDTTGRLLSAGYAGRGEKGDEFRACLPNCDELGVQTWWERKLPKFQAIYPELNDTNISISAGFSILDPEAVMGKSLEERKRYLEERRKLADDALYVAKVRSKDGGTKRGQEIVDADKVKDISPEERSRVSTYRNSQTR